MLGVETNDIIILQEPFRLFQAFWILAGFRLLDVLGRMIYYDIKYYNNAGEDYLSYGSRYVMRLRIMRSKYKELKYNNELKRYFHSSYDI